MNSDATLFVNHFTAALIEVAAVSTLYYPGESASFNYTVTDRLGNIVENGIAPNSTIIISTDSFVGLLQIDSTGYCQICEEGIWLSDVTISGGDVGNTYTLEVSLDHNRFVLGQNEITLNVTGCGIGYGADLDNYTCEICDPFTYNIDEDFVGQCLSCDPAKNPGDVAMI